MKTKYSLGDVVSYKTDMDIAGAGEIREIVNALGNAEPIYRIYDEKRSRLIAVYDSEILGHRAVAKYKVDQLVEIYPDSEKTEIGKILTVNMNADGIFCYGVLAAGQYHLVGEDGIVAIESYEHPQLFGRMQRDDYSTFTHEGDGEVLQSLYEKAVSGIPIIKADTDAVNHPKHYNSHPSGIECIQVTEHMNFNVGNAVKYLWRTDHKNGIEDLKKARWYIDREIKRLEQE